MKIAIIGAHCVGKTTLAKKLQESLAGYDYVPEPYYSLEEIGYLFSEIPIVDDFLEQFEYAINQILKSGDNVIFDRSPIDILAYIQALNDYENIHFLFHKIQSIVAEIDLFVFVPIEQPDIIACPASELPELRSQVNEILNEWILHFEWESLEVNGTLSMRRDQILNKILPD